jgi:outer membrane protein, multidrug efflux system
MGPYKRDTMNRLMICLLTASAALIFNGCAVGPTYVRPDVPAPDVWHAGLDQGLTPEEAPHTLVRWWATLEDPILSTLIQEALAGNLDLKQAYARLREARAGRMISRAGLFPTLDSSGSVTRSGRGEDRGGGDDVDLYAAGFDARWELDLFGGLRRSLEAATAELQAGAEDLRDVQVSLLAEVALNYIEARTFQARLEVAEQNLEAQEQTYDLARWNYEAGLSTELAAHQARYNLENTRSQIPLLRSGLEETKNRLAVLLGRPPGSLHPELALRGPIPLSPPEVAVGVPADALRRRPDVRRAERRLAAQTARVGAATADLYPRFTLFGSIGVQALSLGSLFSAGSAAYSIGPRISLPLFNAGAIRSNIEVQSARQEQALIQYEATVLRAVEEVENVLVAYVEEQHRRKRLEASVEAAKAAVELAENQYQAGLSDFNSLLDAQRSLLSFQDRLVASDGAVVSNLVRLFKGLGGGWTPLSPLSTVP